jgi:hypothetical protein
MTLCEKRNHATEGLGARGKQVHHLRPPLCCRIRITKAVGGNASGARKEPQVPANSLKRPRKPVHP